jgi:hypothetical protein
LSYSTPCGYSLGVSAGKPRRQLENAPVPLACSRGPTVAATAFTCTLSGERIIGEHPGLNHLFEHGFACAALARPADGSRGRMGYYPI